MKQKRIYKLKSIEEFESTYLDQRCWYGMKSFACAIAASSDRDYEAEKARLGGFLTAINCISGTFFYMTAIRDESLTLVQVFDEEECLVLMVIAEREGNR